MYSRRKQQKCKEEKWNEIASIDEKIKNYFFCKNVIQRNTKVNAKITMKKSSTSEMGEIFN